jgi:hypothetical protein
MSDIKRPLKACALALACVAGSSANMAFASTYVTETVDDYTVRCSTVRSDTLPDTILERYGIAGDKQRGVLSCVVQRANPDGSMSNQKADVQVRIENLMQVASTPEVRELLEGDNITYLASYEIPVDTVLQFEVTLSPQGTDIEIPLQFSVDKPWE